MNPKNLPAWYDEKGIKKILSEHNTYLKEIFINGKFVNNQDKLNKGQYLDGEDLSIYIKLDKYVEDAYSLFFDKNKVKNRNKKRLLARNNEKQQN